MQNVNKRVQKSAVCNFFVADFQTFYTILAQNVIFVYLHLFRLVIYYNYLINKVDLWVIMFSPTT